MVAAPPFSSRSNSGWSFSARPLSLSPQVRSVRLLMIAVMPALAAIWIPSGNGVDHLVAHRAHETRRRTRHLRDERCPLGHVGLSEVVLGKGPAATTEDGPDLLDERLVADERDAHDVGDDVTGDVVLGGAEASAHDHGIAAIECLRDDRLDAIGVVAHLGLEVRVDADERQLLPDVGRIGVDDLAEQQLGTDGDDFTPHGALPL